MSATLTSQANAFYALFSDIKYHILFNTIKAPFNQASFVDAINASGSHYDVADFHLPFTTISFVNVVEYRLMEFNLYSPSNFANQISAPFNTMAFLLWCTTLSLKEVIGILDAVLEYERILAGKPNFKVGDRIFFNTWAADSIQISDITGADSKLKYKYFVYESEVKEGERGMYAEFEVLDTSTIQYSFKYSDVHICGTVCDESILNTYLGEVETSIIKLDSELVLLGSTYLTPTSKYTRFKSVKYIEVPTGFIKRIK